MAHIDLQAAVTSWVAQELEERVPGEYLSYWVSIASAPPLRVTIVITAPEHWSDRRVPWPPDEEHVRRAVRRALEDIAREVTSRDDHNQG